MSSIKKISTFVALIWVIETQALYSSPFVLPPGQSRIATDLEYSFSDSIILDPDDDEVPIDRTSNRLLVGYGYGLKKQFELSASAQIAAITSEHRVLKTSDEYSGLSEASAGLKAVLFQVEGFSIASSLEFLATGSYDRDKVVAPGTGENGLRFKVSGGAYSGQFYSGMELSYINHLGDKASDKLSYTLGAYYLLEKVSIGVFHRALESVNGNDYHVDTSGQKNFSGVNEKYRSTGITVALTLDLWQLAISYQAKQKPLQYTDNSKSTALSVRYYFKPE